MLEDRRELTRKALQNTFTPAQSGGTRSAKRPALAADGPGALGFRGANAPLRCGRLQSDGRNFNNERVSERYTSLRPAKLSLHLRWHCNQLAGGTFELLAGEAPSSNCIL